jgi:hypothetical protein
MFKQGFLFGLFVALFGIWPNLADSEESAKISGRPMGNCLVDASNNTIKLRPSFELKMVHEPSLGAFFNDKNEVGQPIEVVRYNGKIDVVFAGRNAVQDYSCTFWRDPNGKWAFSWSGLGGTHVEGFE